ncbi:alpha/beta fold hydrolase [Nocardia sp. NPDC101769]|uniref:alpha/beta fold hydrolase n=1 Tax=Nocardia sp. NPDC101769 TaxID=3364333 RepID=UPI00382167E4
MTTPTIVLVHGAFGDSSMWCDVVARLQKEGYSAIAAANPLRDLESDAQYVATVTRAEDGPVVLVGHSYAGAVITRAAREVSNVSALVYIAAFQPDEGEDTLENATRFPGAKMGSDTFSVIESDGQVELRILPEHYQDLLAGDLPQATTDIMAVTQRPVRQQAVTAQLSGEPAWRSLPSWALIATQDNAIPAQAQEFMAARAGSSVVRVEASHAVSISQPDAVANLIIAAAKATI